MEKIRNLQRALETIGIKTELYPQAEWYCSDNKKHYGIELMTNINHDGDCLSFCFTPNGRYITDCRNAPTVP